MPSYLRRATVTIFRGIHVSVADRSGMYGAHLLHSFVQRRALQSTPLPGWDKVGSVRAQRVNTTRRGPLKRRVWLRAVPTGIARYMQPPRDVSPRTLVCLWKPTLPSRRPSPLCRLELCAEYAQPRIPNVHFRGQNLTGRARLFVNYDSAFERPRMKNASSLCFVPMVHDL